MNGDDKPPSREWLLELLSLFGDALEFGPETTGPSSTADATIVRPGIDDDEATTAACPDLAAPHIPPDDVQSTWPWLSESDCGRLFAAELGPGSLPSRMPSAPGRFGPYVLLRELGSGGFGVVYLALDPDLGRRVALKVARPETMASNDFRRRFEREGQAASRLDHPNVVAVFEVGTDGGFAYIAMPYVEGVTLGHWLHGRESPVPPKHAAFLIRQVAEAVAHAHGRGVLHRDLKPRNILLQAEPFPPSPNSPGVAPRVCDFGLAKVLGGDAEETAAESQIGSPPYMAPELVTRPG
ncbi:MAG: serine/threonine protein kinase, partial [Thermoleophilia bacterium]|nr:serine/threonine protein kinase [Thermoleophilia bacterium]